MKLAGAKFIGTIYQALFTSEMRCPLPGGCMQLFHDISHVDFNGMRGNHQSISNLPVSSTFLNQRHNHLLLPG
jgi:hypothetical protein